MELGKLREHMPIYTDDTGTLLGAIDVHENGVKLKAGEENYNLPLDYVESITPERDLSLGKMQAKMVFYEIMGMKHELRFIISGVHIAMLKKMCGK